MTQEQVIINTTNIIYTKLNIVLPNTNNLLDYNNYLDIVLNKVKYPKIIPSSLIAEKEDLEKRIKNIDLEIESMSKPMVNGDSFGDGMPHAQSDPESEYKKHIDRLTDIEVLNKTRAKLECKLFTVNAKIRIASIEFDEGIKDQVKELIELVQNENYCNVLKSFYIYRMSYKTIAEQEYKAENTMKDYRQRGFKALANILFNFSQKMY